MKPIEPLVFLRIMLRKAPRMNFNSTKITFISADVVWTSLQQSAQQARVRTTDKIWNWKTQISAGKPWHQENKTKSLHLTLPQHNFLQLGALLTPSDWNSLLYRTLIKFSLEQVFESLTAETIFHLPQVLFFNH